MARRASTNDLTAKDALAMVASHKGDFPLVRASVSATGDGTSALYTLNPTARLQKTLSGDFVTWALAIQRKKTLVDYDPGRKPESYEAAVAPTAEVPGLPELIERIEADAPLPLLERTTTTTDLGLNIFSVAVTTTEWVHGIRLRTRAISIERGTLARLAGTHYDLVTAPPLLFSQGYDALATHRHVLMMHQYQFETALDFIAGVQQIAETTLRQATQRLRIANFDELLSAVRNDRRMLAKLRSVKVKLSDPAFQAALQMSKVVALAEQRPDLGISLKGRGRRAQLVFHPDPKRRFVILKLLDDDYLRSLLTDIEYEANSKSRIS